MCACLLLYNFTFDAALNDDLKYYITILSHIENIEEMTHHIAKARHKNVELDRVPKHINLLLFLHGPLHKDNGKEKLFGRTLLTIN